MANDFVSIVIPVYNNADTIIETLLSVENQTYKNIEVIIVDDGSTDYFLDVINNYVLNKKIQNLKVLTQLNSGPSVARNNGVLKATGNYLLFLDADDLLHETYIEKAINIMQNNNQINIVYADVEFFGNETGKWILNDFKLPDFLINNSIPIFAIIKRSVFLEVGMFDTKLTFTEDWELWIRIVKKYGGVHKIQEVLYFYRKRQNKTSLTDNVNENEEITRLYIYNKHYDYYKQNNLGITSLINNLIFYNTLKNKYNNIWYKKLLKKLKINNDN